MNHHYLPAEGIFFALIYHCSGKGKLSHPALNNTQIINHNKGYYSKIICTKVCDAAWYKTEGLYLICEFVCMCRSSGSRTYLPILCASGGLKATMFCISEPKHPCMSGFRVSCTATSSAKHTTMNSMFLSNQIWLLSWASFQISLHSKMFTNLENPECWYAKLYLLEGLKDKWVGLKKKKKKFQTLTIIEKQISVGG